SPRCCPLRAVEFLARYSGHSAQACHSLRLNRWDLDRHRSKRTLTAARKLFPVNIVFWRMSFWRPSPIPPRPVDLLYNSTEPGPWCRSFFLEVGIGLLRRPTPVEPGLESLEDHLSHQGQPVIVGAEPVGLGAALFLARQGRVPLRFWCGKLGSAEHVP